MARTLKVYKQEMIIELHKNGLSNRQIAKRLDIDRNTVNRHVAAFKEGKSSNAATNMPAGSKGSKIPEFGLEFCENGAGGIPECRLVPTGADGTAGPNAAMNLPVGSNSGPKSLCEPFTEQICEWLKQGLSAQRIFQDLRERTAFEGGYDSVKRFVRRLARGHELPFRRMETGPGEQAQVDFGTGVLFTLFSRRAG